jgi:DNA-binding CsgD family transcriptional regulator
MERAEIAELFYNALINLNDLEKLDRFLSAKVQWTLSAADPHTLGEESPPNAITLQGGSPRSLCVLGLSEREAEVLYWVAAGKSSPVISMILGIRHDTVRAHLKRIFAKLGVENRLSAALRALQILRSVPSPQE